MVGIPLLSFPVFPQLAVTHLRAMYGMWLNEDLAEMNHFTASEKLGRRACGQCTQRCGTADPPIRRIW